MTRVERLLHLGQPFCKLGQPNITRVERLLHQGQPFCKLGQVLMS
jgi:hypothetical protein